MNTSEYNRGFKEGFEIGVDSSAVIVEIAVKAMKNLCEQTKANCTSEVRQLLLSSTNKLTETLEEVHNLIIDLKSVSKVLQEDKNA